MLLFEVRTLYRSEGCFRKLIVLKIWSFFCYASYLSSVVTRIFGLERMRMPFSSQPVYGPIRVSGRNASVNIAEAVYLTSVTD